MRLDRYEVIKYLHFKDNDTLNKNDKYCKIRPLLDYLQDKFLEDTVVSEHFVRSQFALVTKCGAEIPQMDRYLKAFDVYQGKTYQGEEEMEQKLGKAPATVMQKFTLKVVKNGCCFGSKSRLSILAFHPTDSRLSKIVVFTN